MVGVRGRLGCGEDCRKPKCDDGKSKNPGCVFGCMFHYIWIEVATSHIYLCFDRVDGMLNGSRELIGADWKEIKVLGTQIVRMLWADGSVSNSVDIAGVWEWEAAINVKS
jgi:hypothetical protein